MSNTAIALPEMGSDVGDQSPARILATAREALRVEDEASALKLRCAVAWADAHPPEHPAYAATFAAPGLDGGESLAGDGCPLVAEHAVAEFGTEMGISTTSAKKLIGHALELRHRLPRLWALVHAGRVASWRARLVAEETIHACPSLPPEAAAWVDAQVAAVVGKVGPAQVERLVAEAIKRFELAAPDPASDPVDGWEHVDPRHATLHRDALHFAGTLRFEAELDLAEALDLDDALSAGAEALKALGFEGSLDVRRSMALGDLARTQQALDLNGGDQGQAVAELDRVRAGASRQVVLHVHLSAAVLGDGGLDFDPIGRLEQGQRLILLDQVKEWVGHTRTRVTVAPVIDLARDNVALGYAVPALMREQVILRDGTCTFPWCSRPARACDIDHVVPYDHEADALGVPQSGPTRPSNLTAICRRHHRLKTQSPWRVEMPSPGKLVWTSPHGHRYLRDFGGTTRLDGGEESPPARARS
ncbi:MAG: HNH endonuclease signature motif containing protein [Nocardioides sp.]|jgi:hypothetical protein